MYVSEPGKHWQMPDPRAPSVLLGLPPQTGTATPIYLCGCTPQLKILDAKPGELKASLKIEPYNRECRS